MKTKTDPYGHLEWCIGSSDDFWCFDYCRNKRAKTITIHAVINSETGSFIQNAFEPVTVPESEAVEYAKGLTDQALDWCNENDVKHDLEAWNQSPCYFWRSIHCDIVGGSGEFCIRIPVVMEKRPQITRNYF